MVTDPRTAGTATSKEKEIVLLLKARLCVVRLCTVKSGSGRAVWGRIQTTTAGAVQMLDALKSHFDAGSFEDAGRGCEAQRPDAGKSRRR